MSGYGCETGPSLGCAQLLLHALKKEPSPSDHLPSCLNLATISNQLAAQVLLQPATCFIPLFAAFTMVQIHWLFWPGALVAEARTCPATMTGAQTAR
jgi:hypothetical protein